MPNSQPSRGLDLESSFSSASHRHCHSAPVLFPDDYSDYYDETSSSTFHQYQPPTGAAVAASAYPAAFFICNPQEHDDDELTHPQALLHYHHHNYHSPFHRFSSALSSFTRKYWHHSKSSFRNFSSSLNHLHHHHNHHPMAAACALDTSTKKVFTTSQQRRELEGEISTLQKVLRHEEKVREILEQVHGGNNASAISIPSDLPPKMKELLEELAMVEEEIAQLEGQISHLQDDLKQEQEVITTESSKSKQWKHDFLSSPRGSFSVPPNPPSTPVKGVVVQERMEFDQTKALHFISKAIRGDYHLNDFSINEKMKHWRAFPHNEENHFQEEAGFSEKIPRKSVLLKPAASPLRDPRHPTPRRARNVELSLPLTDLRTNSPSHLISPQEESKIQKWQPNKLSEKILKCLMFIFVRLTRTSRAMELEKSGPITRSSFSSLSSISFRADTSTNSKSSLILHKETRQQDPYGIFEPEESIPRDIGPYKNLFIFTANSLDPKCISNSNTIPLLEKLRTLMNCLEKADLKFLTSQQKLAFWINMYNACIMHGSLHHGVPSSPENLLALLKKATLNIGGNMINAHAIEHFILRKPTSSSTKENDEDEKETIIRKLYGLESFDANVTFALCYGTRSSPAVRIYRAESVAVELEKSKLEYLQASIIVTSTKRVAFPELVIGNMFDFAEDLHSLVKWVCQQLPTSGTLRKSMVDCFKGQPSGKLSSVIEKIPYDFEFQYILAI